MIKSLRQFIVYKIRQNTLFELKVTALDESQNFICCSAVNGHGDFVAIYQIAQILRCISELFNIHFFCSLQSFFTTEVAEKRLNFNIVTSMVNYNFYCIIRIVVLLKRMGYKNFCLGERVRIFNTKPIVFEQGGQQMLL